MGYKYTFFGCSNPERPCFFEKALSSVKNWVLISLFLQSYSYDPSIFLDLAIFSITDLTGVMIATQKLWVESP